MLKFIDALGLTDTIKNNNDSSLQVRTNVMIFFASSSPLSIENKISPYKGPICPLE